MKRPRFQVKNTFMSFKVCVCSFLSYGKLDMSDICFDAAKMAQSFKNRSYIVRYS